MNLSFSRRSDEPIIPPTHVLLASQSIGRRQLLEKLGVRFRVAVTQVDESTITDKDPIKLVKRRAAAKLQEVITHPRIYTISEEAKNIVIAADSMAIVGKKIYGKPVDRDDAKRILKELMGRTHTLVTAVAVAHLEGTKLIKKWEKEVITKVTMGKIKPADMETYVTRYDLTRYAGAYAINDTPWDLITKVDGSYTNVIGLPFEVLLPIFRQLEVIK